MNIRDKGQPLLSICMPTNGVIDWVFPVLDSIYNQGVDIAFFEVVITDNGNNEEFKKLIKEYLKSHANIVYAETQALPFVNEIEAYKRANGKLIKYVNHRTKLVFGTLQRMIDYVEHNYDEKPVTYFANGVLEISKDKHEYNSFDDFVRNLSYWSSWSTGMTIWKEDFDRLPEDVSKFNELFPHTNVLFNERNRGKYVIDNSIIFDEMPQGKKPKGNYDLFFAFGVDYPGIILDLLRSKSISVATYKKVVSDNLSFVSSLYYQYFIKKEYCSYDLSGIESMYDVFYTKLEFKLRIVSLGINKIKRKIFGK